MDLSITYKKYFKRVIDYFASQYDKQLKITFGRNGSYITTHSEKQTYSYRRNEFHNSDKKYILINVDMRDVHRIMELENCPEIFAIERIILHEAFHYMLGHMKNKEHDKLHNIAQDMEVNSYIGLKDPFIHPEDYGLEPFLTWQEYYKLLKNEQESKENNTPDSEQNSGNDSIDQNEDFMNDRKEDEEDSNNTQRDGKNEKGQNQKEDESNSSNQSESDEQINDSQNDKTNSSVGEYKGDSDSIEDYDDIKNEEPVDMEAVLAGLEDAISKGKLIMDEVKIEKYDKSFQKVIPNPEIISSQLVPDNINEVIHRIKMANSKHFDIAPTEKAKSYFKYNNRTSNVDFISPGNMVVNKGYSKAIQPTYYIFIDVSGSTRHYFNTIFNAIAEKFHHDIGATILFYTNKIEEVIKPSDKYHVHGACGTTDIYNAIQDAEKMGMDIKDSKIFIVTDCLDRSLPCLRGKYNADVYYTNPKNNKIILQDQFKKGKL